MVVYLLGSNPRGCLELQKLLETSSNPFSREGEKLHLKKFCHALKNFLIVHHPFNFKTTFVPEQLRFVIIKIIYLYIYIYTRPRGV